MTGSEGAFFDGRTAASTPVTVEIDAASLVVRRADAVLARWPRAGLRLAGRRPDGTAALTVEGSEARLIVPTTLVAALGVPDEDRAVPRVTARKLKHAALIGMAVAAIGAGLWFGWPPLADRMARFVPAYAANAIGTAAIDSLVGGSGACTTPAGVAALRRLTDRLAATLDPPQAVEVRVIDDEDVNAFAAPGGHLVLLRGLIATAGSAEEVAGVLAHEIGHVVANHPLRLLVRYSGLAIVATVLWGDSNVTAFGTLLVTLSYSRGFELEADALGVAMLQRAGIDSRGLSRFFARVEREGGHGAALQYLSTHPASGGRREAVDRLARGGAHALSPQEWAALQRICG